MRHPLQELQQLQALRGRKPKDLGIGRLIEAAEENATRTHKRLGELIGLWQELLPADVASRTALVGVHRGVLQVRVDSAATAFEVDRLLRSGVEKELRSRYRGSLARVKTRVEPLDQTQPVPHNRQQRAGKSSSKNWRSRVGARQDRR
jgi:hypothetical protein